MPSNASSPAAPTPIWQRFANAGASLSRRSTPKMHEISSYKRPIPPMKTRVPKSYREMPGQRIGADLHAFSSESFAPPGRLQLAISCIFQAVRRPGVPNLRISTPVATPDPPKAVARIRSRPLERAALRCCHLGCRTFSGATIFFIPNTERWPHGSKRRIRPAERARQR